MPRPAPAAEIGGAPQAVKGSTAASLRRSIRVRLLWLTAGLAVLIALALASTMIGSRTTSLAEILAAYSGSAEGFGEAAVAKRIPRTLMAVLAGAALGVSGAVMQGVTRNPLADPGILGVNTGASLAVVVAMAILGLTTASQYIWWAILGGGVTALFVYTIGSLGRDGATPLKLALAGTATAAALTSFISAVVLPRGDIAGLARDWQIGGVGGATMASVEQVLPFLLIGLAISLLSARGLNALALGDELAAGLGQRVALARAGAATGAVVLCGAATAVTGPIGFVGLVVPHVCRLIGGVDHRWLLPYSAIVGACLLTASDIVGRIIARPGELEVGILTALIGAPFFIAIVRRQKVRAL